MNEKQPDLTRDADKLYAIHTGISGFPFGSAAINKCLAVYGSLQKTNVSFLIINNRAIHSANIPVEIKKCGTIDGMEYRYTTTSPYRSSSFVVRNLYAMAGRINEFVLLCRLGLSGRIDVMFYYPTNGSFFELILYRVLSRIFDFCIIAHYVEYRTAFVDDMNAFQRLKHKLYDKYFMRFVDAVLPISEFLTQQLTKRGYNGPYLKVPPLTDYDAFKKEIIPHPEKYFLYVGSAAYLSAIAFIAEAFDKSNELSYSLHLVVNGSPANMEEVRTLVSGMKKRDSVRIFSKLDYATLIEKYLQAKALLIPLTDSITDVARFPQKISEYLASANPVITTNYGEMPFYFTDGENALVAQEYDAQLYAQKMNFVMENPEKAAAIGRKGYETGKRHFDLHSYGPALKKLVLSLMSK